MDSHIGFLCNACGKCCNTPPAMSVPELFRHRDRFIGSLAVGRVRRLAAGSRIAAEGTGQAGDRVLDEGDADALAFLQDSVFHRSEDGWVTLVTQAFDYPSIGRCPALGSDGSCAVHGQDKPLMCRVVPLDPCLPDRLQDSVLRQRRNAAGFMGATCIEPGAPPPYRPLVRHGRVAEPAFDMDLRRRRADLIHEKERWGRAVFGMLEKELNRGAAPGIGTGAYLVLPLVPVLAVLAAESDGMRAECAGYIDAQLVLIETAVRRALERKRAQDRAVTAQLRIFAQAYTRQRTLLA
jgi:Fe-S-cluster containining protein